MTKLKLLFFVAIATCLAGAEADHVNCAKFRKDMKKVKSSLIDPEDHKISELEEEGYTTPDNVFGASPTYDDCSIVSGQNAHLHTVAAQWFKKEQNVSRNEYDKRATECKVFKKYPASCKVSIKSLPKYRSIDGTGNNINNPQWGASDTPFARLTENGYSDGIYEIRKSVSGKDLPNPRFLVDNILAKSVRSNPPPLSYGVFSLEVVVFITHDVHYTTPIQPSDSSREIQCCTPDLLSALPKNESNPSCLPIKVPEDDPCYTEGHVGCYNFVRSQQAEYQNKAQSGQIMNRATSYLDLSLLYGNHESELDPIRTYEGGKLRIKPNGILPVDKNGNYLPSMARFTMVPMASIWPSLFARNHNHMAERLAAMNPSWNDETLFQEARRINIAIFQSELVTKKAVQDSISNIPINETYDALKNAATTLEFAIGYRMAHYYLHDQMLFLHDDGTQETWNLSDTVGRIDILEKNFEQALRGSLAQVVNVGPYGDEITNRVGKTTANGYGSDIIAIDIQRGRDQGLPSYTAVRRACGLPEIKSFDDLKSEMDPINAKLLEDHYDHVDDIDYYVAGMLESFYKLGNPLVGPTFGCVIGKGWDNFAGGDIYYYTNPSSPYPFTQAQIEAIQNFSMSGMICANTNLNGTALRWPFAPNEEIDPATNEPVNPFTSCEYFPDIDLSPWKVSE